MDKTFNDNRKLALKKMQEISHDCKIPLKIENIDKIGKKLIPLINKAVDEEGRLNRETNATYFLGFFLGEQLITKYGGKWLYDEAEDEYIIMLKNGNKLNPFSKATKFLRNGMPDSMFAFYQVSKIFG